MLMSSSTDIPRHLATLRRRIRRVQWIRGILKFFLFFFVGLLLLAAIDFIFAPVPQAARLVFFSLWMSSLVWSLYRSLFRPLLQSISDVKLARWLERRHPEVQERISTSLELSDHPAGISAALLDELSLEAATDLVAIDPSVEVSSQKVRRSLWPVAILAAAITLLLVIFPQEMSRLLSRAISPFSDSGNAGGALFTFEPGDIEVFEGNEVVIALTYEGEDEEMRLFTKTTSGEVFDERLLPVSRNLDSSDVERAGTGFQYRLHRAGDSFEYFARAGKNESDHFKVTVYAKPKLENARVRYEYPAYTEWPDQVTGLTNGLKALAGTQMTIKSRVPLGVAGASFLIDGFPTGDPQQSSSSNGGELGWTYQPMEPGQYQAKMILNHQLNSDFEVGSFQIEVLEDEAPVVELIEPTRRELRLNSEDQVIFNYTVTEQIGLALAEVELEVDGDVQPSLKELLPKRGERDEENLWSGEAMVYLGSLLDRFEGAREFRFRLKLSDNRPPEFAGPGIGYSDWILVRLDQKAQSLARQELRAQQEDLKKTIEEAIRDTRQAQKKMEQAKYQLQKEKIPEHIQKKIAEARDEFAETKKKLEKLSERMENTVQAHRSDEVVVIAEKLSEAQRNAEFTPLQDHEEARRSEAEAALQHSREAVQALQELRNEIDEDRHKIDDLAKLQELAQKQDALAREAESQQAQEPDKNWQKQQERLNHELREMVKQSPQAKAAALEVQAKRAEELSQDAQELSEAQSNLKELSEIDESQPQSMEAEITESLKKEQAQIVEEVKEELADARFQNEERANSLPEAVAQGEEVSEATSPEAAAESAQKAAEALMEGAEESASQETLQERQEKVADAFEALAKGDLGQALAELERMQSEQTAELSEELSEFIQAEHNQAIAEARNESQHGANRADQAMKEQANGKSEQAAKYHDQSAQNLAKAAQKLAQASEQFSSQAEQAMQQKPNQHRVPVPGKPLAEAFEESANAAKANSSQEGAESAQAAAQALQQAAREAKSAMAQNREPGQGELEDPFAKKDHPSQPGGTDQGGEQTGDKPQEKPPKAQADPGVPPELARLGVSASDWEKIRATLKSDVGGSSGAVVPEDYRGLVKKYFEQVTGK